MTSTLSRLGVTRQRRSMIRLTEGEEWNAPPLDHPLITALVRTRPRVYIQFKAQQPNTIFAMLIPRRVPRWGVLRVPQVVRVLPQLGGQEVRASEAGRGIHAGVER